MVSIQQVKKRNDMSKELEEHGFAADYEEAIEQADQIYATGKESPDVSFSEQSGHEEESLMERTRRTMEEDEEEAPESKESEGDIEELRNRVARLEEELGSQNTSDADEQLDTVINKVNEIVKAINDLEERQDSIERRLDGDTEHEATEQEESSETEDTDENPGTGDYGPDDVAVENVFYSGDS